MENLKKGIELNTVEMEDVDLKSLGEHAKNGTLDTIENELSLLGGVKALIPETLSFLSEEEVLMLMMMTSNDIECEWTNKKTTNNIIESYIMTFYTHDSKLGKFVKGLVDGAFYKDIIIDKEQESSGYSGENTFESTTKVVSKKYKIGRMTKYIQLKSMALQFWNSKNLKQYMKMFRDLQNGGISELDKFEDMVYDKAMNSEDSSISARYSQIYSKNKGLDKTKGSTIVNMFHHGGKELTAQLAQASGNMKLDLQDIIDAEVGDGDE